MSASTEPTTDQQISPGCDQADGVRWVISTPGTDEWACRHCGTEWTVTVAVPQVTR